MSDEKKKYGKVTIGSASVQGSEPFTLNNYVEGMSKSMPSEDRQGKTSEAAPQNKSKTLFNSPYTLLGASQGWIDKARDRLTDDQLRDIAVIDPYVSAIRKTRVAQVSPLAGRAVSRFDKGIRIVEKKPSVRKDFENDEEYEQAKETAEKEKDSLVSFLLNCGTTDKRALEDLYDGVDKTFMHCSLKSYFQAQVDNLLTFGRYGRQSLRDEEGALIAFRPVPVETIRVADPEQKAWLSYFDNQERVYFSKEVEDYNSLPEDARPIAYYQVLDGQPRRFFTDEDLKIFQYQQQAYVNLLGYAKSPIEEAITVIFLHHSSLQQLRNMLVKGLLTKGMIALKSMNPEIEVPDEVVTQFKQELTNFSSGTSNNTAVPIIAGPIEVQWVPLAPSLKDSAWQEIEMLIIRCIHSAFQISPAETGQGALGDPGGGINSSEKDNDLIAGEERGLKLIVDILQEDLNSIIFEMMPAAASKYEVQIYGVGNESQEGMLQRAQAEMNLTATYNSLLSMSEKNETLSYGGDVPLNPQWHQLIKPTMRVGKFLEIFMGEEGAGNNPLYDFFFDEGLNQRIDAMKAKSLSAQTASNAAQIAQAEQSVQQSQQPPQPEQPENPPQGAQEASGKEEEVQKSLRDEYRENLHKSFVSEWVRAHEEDPLEELGN